MQAAGIVLAAVAAVVLWKAMQSTPPPATRYYPPAPPPARHWYDTALGFLGTVGGTFLGTYAAASNRTRSTPTPGKAASGQSVNYFSGSSNTSATSSSLTDDIKTGLR